MWKMDNKVRLKLLAGIIILAALLRVVNLGDNPPGFFFDEASTGYDAWSIQRTGRDQWGQYFPIFFKGWGDYKAGFFRYFCVPFIAIGGLNEWTIRLPAAILGILCIPLVFAFARKLSNDDDYISLIAAFFLAISPWHIIISRVGLRMISFIPLFLLGSYLFLESMEDRPKLLIISALWFGLSLYTYSAARVFLPIFLVSIIILYRRELAKGWQMSFISASILVISALPMLHLAIFYPHRFAARYEMISLASAEPTLAGQIMLFIKNWLTYYSPSFLFNNGDANIMFSPPGFGQLYLFMAPLIIIGLLMVIKTPGRLRTLLLIWLLVWQLPGAITTEANPNSIRVITIFPLFELLGAFGAVGAYRYLRPRISISAMKGVLTAIVIVVTWEMGSFTYHYFVWYPSQAWKQWQYGWRQVYEYTQEHEAQLDQIIITGYSKCPLILNLFYTRYEPARFHEHRGMDMKYRFFPQGADIEDYYRQCDKQTLFVIRVFELTEYKAVHTISSPDGKQVVFKMVEKKTVAD